MKLLILLAIVLVSAILTAQNLQVVPLYFLGNSAKTAVLTLTLPLGVWVLFFTLAGLLTSLILRGFLRSPRPAAAQQAAAKPKPNKPQWASDVSARSPAFATEPTTRSPSDWTKQDEDDWADGEAVENWFDEEDLAQPVSMATERAGVDVVRDRKTVTPEVGWQSDLRREAVTAEPEQDSEDWDSTDIYDQPRFETERKVEERRWKREDREEEIRQLEREEQPPEEFSSIESERQRTAELRRLEEEQQREERAARFEREQTSRPEPQRLDPPQKWVEAEPRAVCQSSADPPATPGISIFPVRSNFEVPQKPKTSTQEGTIYSYIYKEPREQRKAPSPEPRQLSEKKPEEVFDVNYRLITPPRSPEESLPEDDDEDWL